MKEYRVTEKQLNQIKDMLDYMREASQEIADGEGINIANFERGMTALNEKCRELAYLVEDIEGQEVEAVKRPVTLLEAVGVSAVISALCPGWCQLKNTFEVAGYKQPDLACPRGADGDHLSCSDCWNRLAEPLEESDHAR